MLAEGWLEVQQPVKRKPPGFFFFFSIGVIMNVLQHMTPNGTPYYDERVEEPILIVILLKSDNGTHIRKVLRDQNKTLPTSELKIGSVALQVFYDLRDVTGKPPIVSGRILDLEINEGDHDPRDMIELMKRLGPLNQKVHLMVKADSQRWRGRWYALLKAPLPEI